MMLAAFPLTLLAQAAALAQPASPTPQSQAAPSAQKAAPARDSCPPPAPNSTQIVICAERPEGYRLDPDVMEAKRETKNSSRPVRPGGTIRPDCATVGPAPCVTAGINLIGAALAAAQMAERLAKGQEVGSMFVTDPHPSEYQLYQAAKARREAEEAEKAAANAKPAQPASIDRSAQSQAAPQPSGN
jgi:hypothetical protein